MKCVASIEAKASGESFEFGDGRTLIYSGIGIQNSILEFKMMIYEHISAQNAF